MLEWRLVPKRFLTISPEETTFARRGFHAVNSVVQMRLEQVGESFLCGYHAALDSAEPAKLDLRLKTVQSGFRGFAFEGAGMSLALQDHLPVFAGRERFDAFLAGPGARHAYMLHVGAGWAFARLPWLRRRIGPAIRQLDPLLCWLAVDGFGFHEGFFHAETSVQAQRVPVGLEGYERCAFDQGLGRSLWFVNGADTVGIAATIASFEERRRGDLWSGAGLACAYAGGLGEEAVQRLADASGPYRCEFAQGVVFAAKARQRAGNPSEDTDLACRLACGMNSTEAAAMADEAMAGLQPDGVEPAYEHWRQRIQNALKRRPKILSREVVG